jgi:UDP-glucuronate 4-epimerase
MKVFLTGTAGFIGSYLGKCLLDRDDALVGLDNLNSYYDVNLKYGRLTTIGISKEAIGVGISLCKAIRLNIFSELWIFTK